MSLRLANRLITPTLRQRCVDFDGVNDYIEADSPFPAGTDFKTQAFTAAGWFATDDLTVDGLFALGTSTGTNYMVQTVFSNPGDGRIRVTFHRSDNNVTGRVSVISAIGGVNANELTHIAVAYDGNGTPSTSTVKIYINGNSSTLATANSTWGGYQFDKVSIGSAGRLIQPLDVKAAGLDLYDAELSAAEVLYLCSGGARGTDPGPTNFLDGWRCSEGSGTTIFSKTGNNDGTLTNAAESVHVTDVLPTVGLVPASGVSGLFPKIYHAAQ